MTVSIGRRIQEAQPGSARLNRPRVFPALFPVSFLDVARRPATILAGLPAALMRSFLLIAGFVRFRVGIKRGLGMENEQSVN